MQDNIIEVDRERFWDWYLSDREDVLNLGHQLKDHLTNSDEPYQTDAHKILNCGIGYLPLSVCITTEKEILSMGFHIKDDEVEGFDKLRFAKKGYRMNKQKLDKLAKEIEDRFNKIYQEKIVPKYGDLIKERQEDIELTYNEEHKESEEE